jgi:uncharacterized repeat protein (TIGR01451 family)
MKKFFIVLVFLFFNSFHIIKANHIAGGNITVQYNGTPGSYLVRFSMYIDCSGPPIPNSYWITATSGTLTQGVEVFLTSNQPMARGNCVMPSTCNSFSLFNELKYEGIINLLVPRSDWVFKFNMCCKGTYGLNINSTTSSLSFQVEATLDNLNFPTNSLPDITAPSISTFCVGVPSTYVFTATDIDADSISYTLIPPKNPTGNVQYNPGFSPYNLFAANVPVTFDSLNGSISFTPIAMGATIFAVEITDYKNGIPAGTIMREIGLYVTNGTYSPNQLQGTVYFDANSNNTKDPGEKGIQGTVIKSPTSNTITITDTSGYYYLLVQTGSQTIAVQNIPNYMSSVPSQYNYFFPGAFQIMNNQDFAIQPFPGGSDLSLTLQGNSQIRPLGVSKYQLSIKNLGTDTVTSIAKLVLDSGIVFDASVPSPSLINGDTLYWNIDSLRPFGNKNVSVHFLANGLPLGTLITTTAELISSGIDQHLQNNYDTLQQAISNSFDPNSKYATPEKGIYFSQLGEEYIDYCINFQNTGTATAINIIITDTLSTSLNLSTIEFAGESHPYRLEITGTNVLKFSFDSIYLPDSSSNQEASKGFVFFRIKPNSAGVTTTSILNRANIYFDNNTPVITEAAITPILNPLGMNENQTVQVSELTVSPNPSKNIISISCPVNKTISDARLSMFDVQGKVVLVTQISFTNKSTASIDISGVVKGYYFIKVQSARENLIGKFIKE